MKRLFLFQTCVLLALGSVSQADDSLSSALQKGISQGLKYLASKQDHQTGAWITPDEPGLTGLVLTAHVGAPGRNVTSPETSATRMGFDFLLKQVKPDGGIYGRGRANYNTSLVLRGNPADQQVIRKARRFLVGQQADYDEKGKTDNPLDGGFGYGESKRDDKPHADLSNTQFALEALYLSKKLFEDSGAPVEKKDDLNWGAAIQFVSRCQNLPGSNDQSWAGQDKTNIGGFVYGPIVGNAGGEKGKGGRTAMRCYGSISYAGMLSFIYAGLDENDPRVKVAIQWLGENYTLDENPGMGAEGLFYYYHTMAKALAAAHIPSLKTKSGTSVDWRLALANKLLTMQATDGTWANTASSRWMEGDPVLVTTYTVLALEEIARSLK